MGSRGVRGSQRDFSPQNVIACFGHVKQIQGTVTIHGICGGSLADGIRAGKDSLFVECSTVIVWS
jgi:hypothetical protein